MTTINIEAIKTMFDNAVAEPVNISELVLDAGTQQRAKVDPVAIENYMEAMQAEQSTKRFPAIKVVKLNEELPMKDGSTLAEGALVLVDGFHRVEAAIGAKQALFQAFVVEASIEEAVYYSMQANATNGVNLKGKDYQNAIKNLYSLNEYWREHGRKQEIAKLLGCSTKTVERACKAIDKEIKAEAFKMFEEGKDDAFIAEACHKSEKTISRWREEWEALQPKNNDDDDSDGAGSDSNDDAGDPEVDPMDLTFAQVLKLKNQELKAKLLKLLMDSIQMDAEEPEQEPEQPHPEDSDEPPFDTDEPSDPLEDLYNQWKGLDCWSILEKTKAELESMKNPKAALKRAYGKQLKKCHPDTKGPNKAIDLLTAAFAEAKKYFK